MESQDWFWQAVSIRSFFCSDHTKQSFTGISTIHNKASAYKFQWFNLTWSRKPTQLVVNNFLRIRNSVRTLDSLSVWISNRNDPFYIVFIGLAFQWNRDYRSWICFETNLSSFPYKSLCSYANYNLRKSLWGTLWKLARSPVFGICTRVSFSRYGKQTPSLPPYNVVSFSGGRERKEIFKECLYATMIRWECLNTFDWGCSLL